MARRFRVFISAVSREFESARNAIADALQARGLEVLVQRSLAHGHQSTLAEMHEAVRSCDRVLAIVGEYSGKLPPEGAVTQEFSAMLPPIIARASITQWEIIFARHYSIATYYFEANGFQPEGDAITGDDAALQAAWRSYLFGGHLGLSRRQFTSADGLRANVLELDWPNLARPKPSNLPGSIGHLFKGRAEFLTKLRDKFTQHQAAAITGKAVHGLGGVGKTRTAIEYGHEYAGDYAATLFLIGKSENDLNDSLAALCGLLHLPEKDTPDLDARVSAVLDWLRANPGWLLIIDNVDDDAAAAAVRAFLDRVSQAGGHVLLTSRVSDWRGGVEPLELDLLSVEAAKELLLESTPRRTRASDEDAALERLADEQLGCLSLALVQGAAYIEQRKIGFSRYSELFDQEAKALLAKLGQRAMDDLGYPLPVALTWQTTIEQLSDAARLLLDMLSFLSIEPIPRSLFKVWPLAEQIDIEEALEELTRYSLVHWEEDNSAITVHRLVAQVTRDNLEDGARNIALNALYPWLLAINPTLNAEDVRCWPQLLPLLPHALKLFERTHDLGPFAGQGAVYDEYAILQQALARYSEAEPLYRQALAIDEKQLGPDNPQVADHLNNLALLLLTTNRQAEAEPLIRRALAIDETRLGPSHPLLANRLNSLGGLLWQTNRTEEAESIFRRALAIDEESVGPEHPNVATRLNNLAGVLRGSGRPNEAEPLFRRAIAIDEASLGPDHPKVAIRLNNLAELLLDTERLDEAEPLLRRAIRINETSLGSQHPKVATGLVNLAVVFQNSGRPKEAEPLFRRALGIDEAAFGLNHPEVATDLNNLAELLWNTDRRDEAEPLYRRAASIMLGSSNASGHLLPNTLVMVRNYLAAMLGAGRSPGETGSAAVSIIEEAGLDPDELWPKIFAEDQ